MQHKRAHRQVYNHTPYGYQRDGVNLVGLPEEQAVICRIRLQHENGCSLREIAGDLNQDGVYTKLGRAWQAQTVQNVLTLNQDVA